LEASFLSSTKPGQTMTNATGKQVITGRHGQAEQLR
jgi:hypothetical protein